MRNKNDGIYSRGWGETIPLYEGLPTLEKHRNMRPLEAYLELVQACGVDKVLIGDISGSVESVQEIASASRGIIPLRYKSFITDKEVLKW